MDYVRRQRQVRRKLKVSRAQAIFVSAPQNVAYLTGFDSTNGFVLLTADATVVFTDFRYEHSLRALAERQGLTPVIVRAALARELRQCCKRLGIRRLAFEADHLTVTQFKRLRGTGRTLQWLPADTWLQDARNRKDGDELELMQQAVRVAEQAFAGTAPDEWLGLREDAAADLLEQRMKAAARGHGWHAEAAFPIIVAAGTNAAVPHHHPGSTTIEREMMVTFDWGARVAGYCSDMTRTLYLGTPDRQFRRVYRTVLRAQKAAIAAYRTGVALKTVDAAARTIIAKADHARHFGHGTGHGIGREVHEGFSASPKGRGRVKHGMVCTVEPGIYIPGWGGVRIEDMVVATPRGTRVMTSLPK